MPAPAWLDADWPAPPGVRALTSLRGGDGVSAPPFDRLNFGLNCGDEPAAVLENRRRFGEWLALPSEPVWLKQVHGTGVLRVDGGPLPSPPPQAGEGRVGAPHATVILHDVGFGLEAGSKPEMLATVAMTDPDTPIICNGFKDETFLRLASLGVQALPLRAAAFLSHEVGGDPEEEGLGVTDLASGLIRRDAEIGLLDNVLGALDAKLAEAG